MPVKLQTPVGVPSPLSLADEKDWLSLVEAQLANTRKTAENWRTGLAGLIGLLTTLSLVKGPAELSGLSVPLAYLVGGVLLLALASAVWGAWMAIEAAYGIPGTLSRDEFREVGGVDGIRFQMAGKTASRLHWAQGLTIASLVLVVIVVALLWYAPRAAVIHIRVERGGAPGLCGELVSSGTSQLVVRPADSTQLRIDIREITALSVVRTCE